MVYGTRHLGVLATCGILILSSGNCPAQMDQTQEECQSQVFKRGKGAMCGPDQRLALMTRNLKLTAEQQAQIRPLLAEEFSRMQALKADDTFSRDERRAKLRQLNQDTYEKIKPLLTEEQQKKHESTKQKIMEKRTKKRSTPPGPILQENNPDTVPAKQLEPGL